MRWGWWATSRASASKLCDTAVEARLTLPGVSRHIWLRPKRMSRSLEVAFSGSYVPCSPRSAGATTWSALLRSLVPAREGEPQMRIQRIVLMGVLALIQVSVVGCAALIPERAPMGIGRPHSRERANHRADPMALHARHREPRSVAGDVNPGGGDPRMGGRV